MTDATTTLVAAKQSFRLGTQLVRQGNVYPIDDEVVAGREHLFEPVENRVRTTASIGRPVDDSPPPVANDDDEGAAAHSDGEDIPERPKGNASRDDWADYITAIGGDVDESAGRDELIELADQLEGGD